MKWPPDYTAVYLRRQDRLAKIRRDPGLLVRDAKEYYRTHPVEFIIHWCDTYDPRNAGKDMKPARMPFILFPRQRDLVEFLLAMIKGEENGLIEKSRDMGATWVAAAFSVWLWLFWPGASIGWGSRKEQLVDRIGDADSIFEKMRTIVRGIPIEFRPVDFSPSDHMTYMKFINPENGSSITGEAGDNIGRGGRKLIYFKDESAHYEHPEKIEASLTDNTRVQIDMSSVLGGTVFERRRNAGLEWQKGQPAHKDRTNVFVMDWSEHPDKSQDWYNSRRKKAEDDGLLHLFAQEVERNYSASVLGVIVPSEWVNAAVDAHIKLDFDDSGMWGAALDVADGEEGGDSNALALRKGVILKSCEDWGERDTGATTRRAVAACEGLGPIELQYDCIGVGSGVKAETNRLVDEELMPRNIRFIPWNAGDEVQDKEGYVIPHNRESPINGDFYGNLKAQGWWQLRRRFELTWRAINEKGFTYEVEDLISLPSTLPHLVRIKRELSQPTVTRNTRMKLIVNKKPEGTRSPNLADAIMMCFWPMKGRAPLIISDELMAASMQRRRRMF